MNKSAQQLGWRSLDPLGNVNNAKQKSLHVLLKLGNEQDQQKTPITFRIKQELQSYRLVLYILSELDLFFLYRAQFNKQSLDQLAAKFSIKCHNFKQFTQFLLYQLEQAEKQEQTNIQINIVNEKTMKVSISKHWNGKIFPIIEFIASKQSAQNCKRLAAFKYGRLRQQISQKQYRIARIKQLVRVKNPYLMSFINRA